MPGKKTEKEKTESNFVFTKASQTVHEIGAIKRQIDDLMRRTNESIERIKGKREKEVSTLEKRINRYLDWLHKFAIEHKSRFLRGKRSKTVKVDAGSFGWRKTKAKIVLTLPEEEVVKNLEELGKPELVRVEKTVNKQAILDNPGLAKGIEGIEIKEGEEEFIVKPAELKKVIKLKR